MCSLRWRLVLHLSHSAKDDALMRRNTPAVRVESITGFPSKASTISVITIGHKTDLKGTVSL